MVPQVSDIRILLVDDDPALLDALPEALSLRSPGVQCDTADGALAALARLEKNDYDAVLTDIKMPGMDGLELLARVREQRPDVPVLLITGHGETDLAIQALRAGAYDLLPKPLDREYLVGALNRAVEAHRLRREVRSQSEKLRRHAEELERRVEERTAELIKANEAKDEFLGLVSHELRTPITVILGNSDILSRREDALPAEIRQQAIADLGTEARRLQRIVENMLILARLDHNPNIENEPILIRELVAAEVRAHRRSFPHRQLDVEIEPEVPLAFAQPTHVELVLRNLLSNAEKYSPPDTAIAVRVAAAPSVVSISVVDSGPGIPADECEAIFSPFYRSHGTAHLAGGVGIGLTVCKRLVEASGGSIWVRPPGDGPGSEFGFEIPVFHDVLQASPDRIATPAQSAV